MKLPKDVLSLALVFVILFVLIKGFRFGEFFGNLL